MAAIPVTGDLPEFPQGAAFSFTATLTVGTLIPDPNTWTDCRLVITPFTGVSVVVSKASFTTFAVTGTGPWNVDLVIPLTQAQTLTLNPQACNYQIDFLAGTQRDILARGTVNVLAPSYPLE